MFAIVEYPINLVSKILTYLHKTNEKSDDITDGALGISENNRTMLFKFGMSNDLQTSKAVYQGLLLTLWKMFFCLLKEKK